MCWRCPSCSIALAQIESQTIRKALMASFSQGVDAFFLTVTDGSVIPLAEREFNSRFGRLMFNLRRAGLAPEHYIATLDLNPVTGRLHRHVVALGGPDLTRSQLDRHAERAGLGFIHHQKVQTSRRDARDLAAYVARNALHFARSLAGTSGPIRPITRSR
jgi:hypothetical protein